METNFKLFISIWSILSFIGGLLILTREDSSKLLNDANFIMTKGKFIHKVTYVLIAVFLLPFTILSSINHLSKRK